MLFNINKNDADTINVIAICGFCLLTNVLFSILTEFEYLKQMKNDLHSVKSCALPGLNSIGQL